MATLGTFFGGTWLAMRGGNKDKKPAPPIKADSGEEEKFIQYVTKQNALSERNGEANCTCAESLSSRRRKRAKQRADNTRGKWLMSDGCEL